MAINFLLLGGFQSFILGLLLFFTSLFLIFIVLIQRGRGGGLTGALGGTGQSAFGSRAGDELTYITLVVAGGWIFLCIVCIWVLNPNDATILVDDQDSQQTQSKASSGEDNMIDGPTGSGGASSVSPANDNDDATSTDADAATESTEATDGTADEPGPEESGSENGESTDGSDDSGDSSGDDEAPSTTDDTTNP